ncbi:GTPase IMAP family member 1 [Chelonia mydas]|uniref:GTPase IMAP family member 1 n=1 Tax=Chelonia mydas TaxID=8469 RepID=M7BNI9_CHEMY|nr:GTPase IMAP family member 1 [Chelonia mydas]
MQVGRFTEEEKHTIKRIQDIFGEKALQYMIFLFTRKDDLGDMTLPDYLKALDDKDLQKLMEKCGNRCCAFNNKAKGQDQEAQISELIAMIDKMVHQNGGSHYTNERYEYAQQKLQEKIKKLRKYYEEDREIKKREVESQYEEECKKIDEELQKGVSYNENTLKQWKEALGQKLDKDLEEINTHYQAQLRELWERADDPVLNPFTHMFSNVKRWFQ